ncbi:MAG: VanZ family protein [Roseibacillus sp.]
MKTPAFARRHHLWSGLFLVWFVTLWTLSSRPLQGPKLPLDYPVDKVLHFGYFFGGAGLLTATLFLQKRRNFHWSTIHLLVVLILFAVGSLDEWHQSWYPFRSGNDSGDLTADILGALAGTLIFRKLQPKLFAHS